jgi:hypothetical protein
MEHEQIQLVPPTPPPLTPGQEVGLGVRNAAQAVLSPAATAYDMLYAGPRNLASFASSTLGGPSFPTPYAGERTSAALDALGLPRPVSKQDMIVSALTQGLGGTATDIAMGNVIRPFSPAVGDFLAMQPGRQLLGAGLGGAASGTLAAYGYNPTAQFAAGVLAGTLPGLVPGGSAGLVAADDRQLLNRARAPQSEGGYNIPIPGALAGPEQGRFFYSTVKNLPLAGGREATAETRGAYNASIADTFGENATKLTLGDGGVYDNAKTRIGQWYQNAAANGSSYITPQQWQTLAQLRSDAMGLSQSGGLDVANRIDALVQQINNNNGMIPGKWLVNELRQSSPTSRGSKNPSQVQDNWYDLRQFLNDSLANAPGVDMKEYQLANQQWRNMRVAEKATNAAGDIMPGTYSAAAAANAKKWSGADPRLLELGDIGNRFIREPPSSGSVERALSVGALTKLAEASAALVYGGHAVTGAGDPATALITAAAPAIGVFAGGPVAAHALRVGQRSQVPDISLPGYVGRTAATVPTQAQMGTPGITAPPTVGTEQMNPYWRALMNQQPPVVYGGQ